MDLIINKNFDFIAHYKAVKKRIADAAKDQQTLKREQEQLKNAELKRKEQEQLNRIKEIAQSVRPIAIDVLREMASKYNVTIEDICGNRRTKELIDPRYEFCWIMNKKHKWTLTKIAKFLGKDHTTILHGINKFSEKNNL